MADWNSLIGRGIQPANDRYREREREREFESYPSRFDLPAINNKSLRSDELTASSYQNVSNHRPFRKFNGDWNRNQLIRRCQSAIYYFQHYMSNNTTLKDEWHEIQFHGLHNVIPLPNGIYASKLRITSYKLPSLINSPCGIVTALLMKQTEFHE